MNFPSICSNNPEAPTCGVHICYLIRHCTVYQDRLDDVVMIKKEVVVHREANDSDKGELITVLTTGYDVLKYQRFIGQSQYLNSSCFSWTVSQGTVLLRVENRDSILIKTIFCCNICGFACPIISRSQC